MSNLLDGDNAKLHLLRTSQLNKLDDVFSECVAASNIEGALKRAEIIASPDSEATLGARLVAQELPGSLERIGGVVAQESKESSIRRARRSL